jgi:short-subunit dehydrogenase
VSRRANLLEELRREIESSAPARVEPIVADMARPDDVERVLRQVTHERRVYAAVLNAGVTHFGHYDELPWSDFETMSRVNVASTMRLTTGLLPYLGETGEGGGVMLVASIAGMTPVPYQAAYSGTKALRASNLCASVSCPSMRLHAKASRHSGPESSCTCRAGSIASARPC